MTTPHAPFPADGFTAGWRDWSGDCSEELSIAWDNEGWTASGQVERHDAQYVVRLSPLWHVRQFLLFRDLDEPDLWLGTDGHGRWGEINGAHRVDLDGGIDIALACTPFTHTIPIRRLNLGVGEESPTVLVDVDVETLGVVRHAASYRRVSEHTYRVERADGTVTLDVDAHGVPRDLHGRFRRTA